MSEHSVAEARNKLSGLIKRALKGEPVTITHHGKPVVRLEPIKQPARRITQDDIDWLDRNRVGDKMPSEDAATAIRKMRDEGWT